MKVGGQVEWEGFGFTVGGSGEGEYWTEDTTMVEIECGDVPPRPCTIESIPEGEPGGGGPPGEGGGAQPGAGFCEQGLYSYYCYHVDHRFVSQYQLLPSGGGGNAEWYPCDGCQVRELVMVHSPNRSCSQKPKPAFDPPLQTVTEFCAATAGGGS